MNPTPGSGISNVLPLDIHASHPVPVISSVVEIGQRLIAGVPQNVELDVVGAQFVTGSVVRWNGANRATTALNRDNLKAEIPTSDFALPGTAQVTVFNPAPGGGTSNMFTMQIDNPIPGVCACANTFVRAGDPGTTLRVDGNGFNASSVVRWNGQDRPTILVDWFNLDVSLSAADIAFPGSAQLTVFNPTPGGGLSNPLTIEILAPISNDSFASAMDINSAGPLPFNHAADTRGATTEPNDPFPTCLDPIFGVIGDGRANSIWYKYTSNRDVLLYARSVGENLTISPFSVLSVWTVAPGSLTQIACMQDNPVIALDAEVTFQAIAGTTYYFMVSESSELRDFFLAEAAPAAFPINLTKTGTGSGTVTSAPPGIDCGSTCSAYFNVNSVVTMTAAAATGSVFAGWGGDCIGLGTCMLTMSAARSVSAAFDPAASAFDFGPPPPSVVRPAGQPAQFTLTVNPQGGTFNDVVTFACTSGVPPLSSCSFSPASVTPGSNPAATTLTITTTATGVAAFFIGNNTAFASVLLLPLLALLGVGERRRSQRILVALLLTASSLVFVGCGGGVVQPRRPGTPPGTYAVTITAASGNVSRSTTVTLVVQ
jgi:hypothetical protein